MNPVPKPEPRIAQYEKMFFGIQMHWGLYSLRGQGEWIMSRKQIPASEYNKLADTFTAEDFNPRAIARLAKEARCTLHYTYRAASRGIFSVRHSRTFRF